MVTGTFWIWDGRVFTPRPLDRHHCDAYELLDGDIPEPDLVALAEVMAINPDAHAILAPDFKSWGRIEGSPKWESGWAGMYYHDIGAVVALRWHPVRTLAHELCHSIVPALGELLDDDNQADEALAKWLRILRHHGTPTGYPAAWWESSWEEPLCLSYDRWHIGDIQPHGLALPRQVERIYRGIKSGKVWRKYMA
jgi:hypothetical protein